MDPLIVEMPFRREKRYSPSGTCVSARVVTTYHWFKNPYFTPSFVSNCDDDSLDKCFIMASLRGCVAAQIRQFRAVENDGSLDRESMVQVVVGSQHVV
jgi:hypothetical protein